MTYAARPSSVGIRIVCAALPPPHVAGAPTEFGLQDRTGALLPGRSLPDGSLAFDAVIAVKDRGGLPDFGGPVVFGTPGERFLYLGYRVAGSSAWVHRVKVMLAGLDWHTVEDAAARGLLQASVRGDRGGRTPLLDGGWSVVAA